LSADLSEIRYGRIVWATVRDHRGYRKRRPAIVVTPDAEIAADQPLVLMAITTAYPDQPGTDIVELPTRSSAPSPCRSCRTFSAV
jgi:hypothetical protein